MTDRCPVISVSHRAPPSFFCRDERGEDNARKGKGGGWGGVKEELESLYNKSKKPGSSSVILVLYMVYCNEAVCPHQPEYSQD
jgi:hypothetical protein